MVCEEGHWAEDAIGGAVAAAALVGSAARSGAERAGGSAGKAAGGFDDEEGYSVLVVEDGIGVGADLGLGVSILKYTSIYM